MEQKSSVEEILQTLVDNATAWGYGVAEADIIRFNDSIGQDVITAKGNKLLGVKYIGESGNQFAVADFDYGSDILNQKKSPVMPLIKAIYQAYQQAQKI